MSLIIEIRLSCIFYSTIDLIACRLSWGIIMVMVMVGQWKAAQNHSLERCIRLSTLA